MDLLLPVFQLLYFVIHFLFSLCQAVYDTLHDVYRVLCELYLWLRGTPSKGGIPSSVGKLPCHPVLVLLPGHYSPDQLPHLARLMTSLAQAGVRHLTAYDAAGKVRHQQLCLKALLDQALPDTEVMLVCGSEDQAYHTTGSCGSGAVCGSGTPACTVAAQCGSNSPKESSSLHSTTKSAPTAECNSSCNGASYPRYTADRVYVNLISFESGCTDLMSCVRDIARHTRSNLASSNSDVAFSNSDVASSNSDVAFSNSDVASSNSDVAFSNSDAINISTEQLHKRLARSVAAQYSKGDERGRCCLEAPPDPDLVIVVGDYLSSNGFPAWFLRLSEFVRTPNLQKIDSNELSRILGNYAKVEQRYGR